MKKSKKLNKDLLEKEKNIELPVSKNLKIGIVNGIQLLEFKALKENKTTNQEREGYHMESTVTIKDIYNFIKEQETLTNKPVGCKVIRDHFGLNHIRRVTEAIQSLRLQGYPISSDGRGYSLKPAKPNLKKIQKTSDSMMQTLVSSGGLESIKHIKETIFALEKDYYKKNEPRVHQKQISIFDIGA